MVDIVMLRERQVVFRPIHGARRSETRCSHRMVPAALEDVPGTRGHCRRNIRVRIGQRIAHAGLCGKIDHDLEFVAAEQLRHDLPVGEIGAHEFETVVTDKLGEPGFLERHVIIVIDIVEPDNSSPGLLKQVAGEVKPDEACGSGDEDRHLEGGPHT